jgi:hypothetical protein
MAVSISTSATCLAVTRTVSSCWTDGGEAGGAVVVLSAAASALVVSPVSHLASPSLSRRPPEAPPHAATSRRSEAIPTEVRVVTLGVLPNS